MGFFDKLKKGLEKTRNQISERTMDVISIFKKKGRVLMNTPLNSIVVSTTSLPS